MDGIQVFRLQIVDADDNVVCRFAAGGKVEVDLVNACVEELRGVYLGPAMQVAMELDKALPTKWYHFGFVRKTTAVSAAHRVVDSWHTHGNRPTDWDLSKAITTVILRLKQHMITVLRERLST